MNNVLKSQLVALSGAALCVLASGNVVAEEQVGQWYVTPMFSFIDDDENRGVDDDWRGGHIGLGKVLNNNWRFEMNVMGADLKDPFFGNDQQMRGIGVDWLKTFRNDSAIRPFLLGGFGYQYTDFDRQSNESNLTTSLGAGLLTNLGNSGWALRTEARLRSTIGTPTYNDVWYNVGLQVPLGQKAAPMPADSDNDGVNDGKDRCPDTAPGVTVDAMGCEVVMKKMDSDRDGVEDGSDRCPNTPAGARVDARGCELDSDNDGVVDSRDRCPNTAAGVRVDVNGCEIKETIDLPGVQFEYDSAALKRETTRTLDDAAATLRKHPDIEVEVAGHTDNVGSETYNRSLSQRRADSVAKYLQDKGISSSRMRTRGYGESEPRATNATDQGRAMNRRVELRVLNQ